MSIDQFFDFINGCSGERPPSQRLGQWAFNLLHEAYPEVANSIRGSEVDPFYDDSLIPRFLRAVLVHVSVQPRKGEAFG